MFLVQFLEPYPLNESFMTQRSQKRNCDKLCSTNSNIKAENWVKDYLRKLLCYDLCSWVQKEVLWWAETWCIHCLKHDVVLASNSCFYCYLFVFCLFFEKNLVLGFWLKPSWLVLSWNHVFFKKRIIELFIKTTSHL